MREPSLLDELYGKRFVNRMRRRDKIKKFFRKLFKVK